MRKLRVLVACEESQAVAIEFRKLGHEAFSCDLLPCSGGHPEWHIQGDAIEVIKEGWDIIIMHPPCTKIAVSGNRWYGVGMAGFNERVEAVVWTQKLWDKATFYCNHVAMENPVGVLNSMGRFPKPHYIQPWQFGHGETKKTGLWLHGLPPLTPTEIVEGREQKIWKMPPSKDRGKLRSKTYTGIAKAIAEQYSNYVLNQAN